MKMNVFPLKVVSEAMCSSDDHILSDNAPCALVMKLIINVKSYKLSMLSSKNAHMYLT